MTTKEAREVRITFPGAGAPELQATARGAPDDALWAVLRGLRVSALSPYSIHARDRTTTCAKLVELDGSPVSPERAAQVLEALHYCIRDTVPGNQVGEEGRATA